MSHHRPLGSAQRGLGEWLWQRLTAIYLVFFILYVFIRLLIAPIATHDAWRAWLTGGGMRIALMLGLISALWHAWIGLRSVCMDYLHPGGLKFIVQILIGAGLLALLFWSGGIVIEGLRP
jgi:succinate dehydrogenase / fumarate reductase membrane anchor subunit